MFHDASHLAPVAVVLPPPNNPLLDDHILARRSAATGGVRLIEEDTRGWLLPALDAAFPGSLLPALETYLAKSVGATEVQLLLVDYDLETLQCYVGAQDLGLSTSYPIGASAVGRRSR
jgi:hypothetical protein